MLSGACAHRDGEGGERGRRARGQEGQRDDAELLRTEGGRYDNHALCSDRNQGNRNPLMFLKAKDAI